MNNSNIRSMAKSMLPKPIRGFLRACLHYSQRVGRWPIILWQVRGVTWSDQWALVRSAIAAPILSFKKIMEWQDPILLTDANVEVKNIGKFAIRAHCDDLWHILPWREKSIIEVLKNRLKKDDIFIDAGANIGIYSVLASKLVGENGKVFSVEMMPDTFDRLSRNLELNGISNVEVCQRALSNIAGEIVTAEVVPGKYGQASIAQEKSGSEKKRISVTTTTLDELSKNFGPVRLIKMDLEGAEELALQGAKILLGKVDALIYESWGTSFSDKNSVDDIFREAGFRLDIIDGNNWLATKNTQESQQRQTP